MQTGSWLWWHASMPSHIVIQHEDALWLVPYRPGGWEARSLYRAYQESLREVAPTAAQRLLAQHVGYPSADPDPLISLAEAAARAEVNPASLRHAIRRGALHATKPGHDWLVTTTEIERYIAERRPRPRRSGDTDR